MPYFRRMLARLILALLLAAFALPASAPAACHDAQTSHTMTMAAPMAMDYAPEQKAPPQHGCIGCVPPSNWSAARLLAPAPRTAATMIERAAVLDLRDGGAPALRPPRLA